MPFIRINNRKNFLLEEVPVMHPKSLSFIKFWKGQKKRCIEGMWSKDSSKVKVNCEEEFSEELLNSQGDWRFMPGNLYFYVNYGTILKQDDDGPKSAPKKKLRPDLRDVEWEFAYNWIEARGFSGFRDDEIHTCNKDVEKLEKDPESGIKLHKSCYNSKGELKKYVSPREYLRKLHDTPLGPPLYENNALNLFVLGARGFGKSYFTGVGIVLYEIVFDGAKYYTQESITNPYQIEVFVGASLSSKSSDILKKTKVALEELPGEWGSNTESYQPSPFFKQMSGTLSPNNMKNPWRHEYEEKVGGTWKIRGTGSNVKHGIYTTENPEAAAGTRPGIMVVEEVGLVGNILQVHGSNTACQIDGTKKFGSSIYIGTGGNVDKIQESEIMFRDPEGFDFVVFEDEWEGAGKLGWFVPAIYGLDEYKDDNGNTDVVAATRHLEKIRETKKKSKDSSALSYEMMNRPLIPSEMFLNAKGSIFPQAELKAHLAYVKANPHKYENAHYFGELVWIEGKLKWEHLSSGNLVREWPIRSNKDKPGVIEIFEMPKEDNKKIVFSNRYIQGTDTYDDDESVTNSLGSTFVFDLWTNRIVAEYTGRRGAKDFYEITRKLNIFYRCVHNYEKNKKGLYTYYEHKNCTHLLCDTPESLKDVEAITISKVGNQAKGTTVTKQITAYGLRLILDWLLEPAYGEENEEIRNIYKIRSQGLLNELISYHTEYGNYDRVSALVMVMILKEEMYKITERRQERKIKSLSEDEFFVRHFQNKPTKNKINYVFN
jgi:hypothetical protein